jgi:hypothetical protein
LESKMAVLAGELTRNVIWDALKSRRFYATQDKNMEVSFKIQGQEMGSVLYPGSYTGEIRLHDANGELFSSVDLIRNGIIDQTFQVSSTAPLISFACDAGNSDYFYIRVYQEDGDQAISSPIFFEDNPGATALSEFSENGISIRVSSSDARNLISINGTVKPETLAVADLTGHIVTMLQIHPGEVLEISRETFPCGMYLVFMADHREAKVQKLLVR